MAKDLFMNFADVSAMTDAANSGSLVEAAVNTGLSIRGQLIWLIHLIEVTFPILDLHGGTNHQFGMALSTRAGLATMPNIGEGGLIARMTAAMKFTTSGAQMSFTPLVLHYLPPIPLASPQISIYVNTNVDLAGYRAKTIHARLGFTTAPLDAAAYTEIAEVWGW